MHTYKKILALMLISSTAISSESHTSATQWSSSHLRAPSGVPSSITSNIGSMDNQKLLQGLGQLQKTTEKTSAEGKTYHRPTGYEELYALVSTETYADQFLRDINEPLISRVVLRPDEDGDITQIFPRIFEDLREKQKASDNKQHSNQRNYDYYRENVRQLLVVWKSIVISGANLFDRGISFSVDKLMSPDQESRTVGIKLLEENARNITTLIAFFNKYGDFISQVMEEQRRSLRQARFQEHRTGHHASHSNLDVDSVTFRTVREDFDITPTIERLNSQLRDTHMCLTLQYLHRKDILKSELWKKIEEKLQSRKSELEAIEQKNDPAAASSTETPGISPSSPLSQKSK